MNWWKRWRLKRRIRKWVRYHSFLWVRYSRWYVGITNSPRLRKAQHANANGKKPRHWMVWDAGSCKNALAIERYFGAYGCGMKGGKVKGNAKRNSRFVYVYK